MPAKRIAETISKLINPARIFIALMLAVIFWLLFTLIPNETLNASGQDFAAPGERCGKKWDCGNGCCAGGECSDTCGGGNQPPAITGSFSCLQPGNNGWCIGSGILDLVASDPQGQPIIISGDVSGLAFACPYGNTSCSVPLTVEGYNAVTYIVNSSTGLSASGSVTYQLDFSTPQLNGSLNGVKGTNGWFTSDVLFSASASDAISGLAALQTSIDSGGWIGYTAPITLADGIHIVALRAYDYAGNVGGTTQTISIDTLTPLLDSSVSGAAGLNSWYVSSAKVSATASDSGSGLFMLEVSIDGGAWMSYSAPIILGDGVHTVQFRATDNAGNVTESTQTVKVDTITPSLNFTIAGTKGLENWYVSPLQIPATTSDAGSGIAVMEAVKDGGVWTAYTSPLNFGDGVHTFQFRSKDNAGNVTVTPVQNIKIDTIAPFIDMTETLSLGETVDYSLEDNGSGLRTYRAVIEDEDEKYKKIVWLDSMSGNKLEDQILWDGKFADGTQAGWGEYFITLKISDAAGNERMNTAVVTVNPLSFLHDIPTFTPPQASQTIEPALAAQEREASAPATDFGGMNAGATGETTSLSTSGGTRAGGGIREAQEWITKPISTPQPEFPASDILWGAAATALVGATLAEWQRKREEEELAKRLEREESANGKKGKGEKGEGSLIARREAEKAHDAAVRERWAAQEKLVADSNQRRIENKMAKQEAVDEARWTALQTANVQREREKVKAEELQAGLMSYYQGGKEGEIPVTPVKEEKPWWEKAWDWTFKNQTELSLGTGVVLGAAAVVIVLTGVITAPAWLIVGGAVLATAALVTAGTVALNSHFGLDLGNNLGNNLIAGTAAALITAGAGLLLANVVAPWVSTTVAGACAQHTTVCNQIGTIIDKGEEALLAGQLAYYTWIGDQDNAAQTAIELQMEQMDGDVPGNSVAKELGEQINKLGPDAAKLIVQYGDDIAPLLVKYGDDAVDIIGAYGDEGIALLLKYGDKADDAITLVKEFGTPAVKVLDAVDFTSAKTLLTTLDTGALDYALTQGPDAVKALSYWPDDFLVKYGDELVLRAKDDARTLEAASKLVKIEDLTTDEARELIDAIAYNSIQGGGDRLVLGKWVNDGTLDNGFIGVARADGALFYGTNPGLDKILSKSTDLPQEDLFWAVNNRVLEISVAHDFKIDYSFSGLSSKAIDKEVAAISALAAGKSRDEVAVIFGGNFPFRMREVEVLVSNGYKFEVDGAASIIHWTKP